MDRINAVLRQAICLGIGLGNEGTSDTLENGEASALPAKPNLAFASANGVDNILIERCDVNVFYLPVLKPVRS